MNRMIQSARMAALAVALFTAGGCASMRDYNRWIRPAREAMAAGDLAAARTEMVKRMKGPEGERDERLNPWMELGMIDHTAGDFGGSARALARALEIVRADEERAVVSATEVAAQAATLIVNERAQPYRGESFEKTLLHTLQAVNYLMNGDVEGARVETLRAWQRQRQSEREHEEQLTREREESKGGKVSADDVMSRVDQAYADQAAVAGRLANAYQNAFTHFLAAIIFNARREPNDAYIELKRAVELRPRTPCLGALTIESAAAGGFREDLPRWEEAFGLSAEAVLAEARERPAELVVIFENGWAPLKRQIWIPIPTPWGVFTLAIPKYELQPGASDHLEISVAGVSARTDALGDIEAQAVRSLRDRMKVYVIKMVVRLGARAAASYALQQQMKEKYGDEGQVAAFLISSAVNIALEHADLRAWTLLPRDFQAARLRLPAGEAEATLRLAGGEGGGASRNLPLRLSAERPTIVLVRSAGSRMFVHTSVAAGDTGGAAAPTTKGVLP